MMACAVADLSPLMVNLKHPCVAIYDICVCRSVYVE